MKSRRETPNSALFYQDPSTENSALTTGPTALAISPVIAPVPPTSRNRHAVTQGSCKTGMVALQSAYRTVIVTGGLTCPSISIVTGTSFPAVSPVGITAFTW